MQSQNISNLLRAPSKMYALRGKTVKYYADDNITNTRYTFNSLGFRSDREFDVNQQPIIVMGNTLSFGLGLDIKETWPELVSIKTGIEVYNFSFGRYGHENHDQLELLDNILKWYNPKLVIFQINDLNRYRINDHVCFDNPKELIIQRYFDFKTKLDSLLTDISNIKIIWDYDDTDYGIDFSECLIHNKYHIDSIPFSDGPMMGVTSHKIISEVIVRKINETL